MFPRRRRRRLFLWYVASPQQGDLRLSGPPSGQGAGGGARTRDRRVRPRGLKEDLYAIQDTLRALIRDHLWKDWPKSSMSSYPTGPHDHRDNKIM
ncbi:hypothetical protein PoB_007101200 [Plakobranchus ocellatus]|uniref:Uncharacterized protein n=1 Tax=Plakobranchus ocellatus TaxID=259542 RepID=A0AAV4DJP6_9GAST|nr:hypothetical protein PoB_007101200 [Plakobranchus ocellatus]